MNLQKKKLTWAVALALGAAMPISAFATNGYFSHGYGTKSKGLAGGGVALPLTAMDAATNPANMALVGDRLDIGLALFAPIREYTVSGTPGPGSVFPLGSGTVESDNELFFIPHIAYNRMLGSDRSVGVTVYGNGGMNTEYPASATPGGVGTFGAGTAGVDLSQLFIAFTYAQKVAPNVALGISPILAYQRFEAYGLGSFGAFGLSQDPNSLSDEGYDDSFGYGARLGVNAEVMPGLMLGASYQTKMSMEEFDKYKGLFAENGDFDIPSTWVLGAAFAINPDNTVTFDVQRINYSEVDAVGNPLLPSLNTCFGTIMGGGSAAATPECLGGASGPGFGWEDMTIYKLGYQFKTSPDWTWRVGYSKGDQPIPSSEVLFNILAPAVMEQHYTAGFTWNVQPDREVNFAAMYAPENTVSGPNPLAPGQNIDLTMKQYELEVSYGMKF